MEASVALLSAVHAALKANNPLMALVRDVYDYMPKKEPYPFLTYGEMLSTDNGTNTSRGKQHTVVIHVYTQGKGSKQAREIAGMVEDLLDDQNLTLTGHDLDRIYHEQSLFMPDQQEGVYHGVVRFAAFTSKQP